MVTHAGYGATHDAHWLDVQVFVEVLQNWPLQSLLVTH